MKLSLYVKAYPSEERPGHLIVYSTKKASSILIGEAKFSELQKGILSHEEAEALAKTGIMVPDTLDERKEMSGILERLNAKSPVLNLSVIINLDCNFSCVYCYEGNSKGRFYMSKETADLLIGFIKEKFTEEKKRINIDFYGGEPLLSRHLIEYISSKLRTFTESRGASYTFTLVTNGSLLKKGVAEDLVRLGLTTAKITIDGPAETHNRYRPYKTGAGSFDTIIGNVRAIWDIVKVAISGNYDRYSYLDFVRLLDDLPRAGLTTDRVYAVKFSPVLNRPKEDVSPADYNEGCISINEPWLLEADLFLREEILKRGYYTPKIIPSPCQVEIKDYYVVNHDGALYRCPAMIGREGFRTGGLAGGVEDYSFSHGLGNWKNEECLSCEYLPLCFGGCRYMAFVREGDINQKDCKKRYFDASLETLIKQDLKYGRQQGKK